jgi:hypothetical protein
MQSPKQRQVRSNNLEIAQGKISTQPARFVANRNTLNLVLNHQVEGIDCNAVLLHGQAEGREEKENEGKDECESAHANLSSVKLALVFFLVSFTQGETVVCTARPSSCQCHREAPS